MNDKSNETLKKGEIKENKPDKKVFKSFNSALNSVMLIKGKLTGRVSTIVRTMKVRIDKKKSPIIK